jgi:Protein of unknown function (DUF3309)
MGCVKVSRCDMKVQRTQATAIRSGRRSGTMMARLAGPDAKPTFSTSHRLAFGQRRRTASRNFSDLIHILSPGLDEAEETKMLGTILIIILILLLIGALPTWAIQVVGAIIPAAVILIIVVILILMGRI